MASANYRTLGLFAKWPLAGHVKTRLAAATSQTWAAQVALAFLQDSVQRLAPIPARRVLAFAPPSAMQDFAAAMKDGFELQPQANGDLGQRMAAFFSSCLTAPAERVVLVGTDSPTLPVAYVERAFDELGNADVVIVPATDGGYCLIGCARHLPPIFDGIAWSESSVLADTVVRVRQAHLKLALLPPWYDVDTLDDWHMLRGHVTAMRLAGADPGVPFTEALMSQSSPTAYSRPFGQTSGH